MPNPNPRAEKPNRKEPAANTPLAAGLTTIVLVAALTVRAFVVVA